VLARHHNDLQAVLDERFGAHVVTDADYRSLDEFGMPSNTKKESVTETMFKAQYLETTPSLLALCQTSDLIHFWQLIHTIEGAANNSSPGWLVHTPLVRLKEANKMEENNIPVAPVPANGGGDSSGEEENAPEIPHIPEDAQWNCIACTMLNPLTIDNAICVACETDNAEQVEQMLLAIDPHGLLLEAAANGSVGSQPATPPPELNSPPPPPPAPEPVPPPPSIPRVPPEEMKEFPKNVFEKNYLRTYYRHFLTAALPQDVAPLIPPDLVNFIVHYIEEGFSKGDVLEAQDKFKKWCAAEVLEAEEGKVLVHYTGWSNKWDEWIDVSTGRIVPLYTHTDGKNYVSARQAEIVADPNLIAEIAGMGFTVEQATEQLKRHHNNLQAAANALIG
jgi:hypothetical protein